MGTPIKILIVEDEMLIGANISMLLTELGYEVTGILPRGEDALAHLESNPPDILLLDVHLKGNLDGIETAARLQQKNIPVIYLTANSDDATFNRARDTRPAAFITKPFKQLDLQRAIELTISRLAELQPKADGSAETDQSYILSDRLFVRHKERMIKLMLADILYMEADRNYSRIFMKQKEFLLSITLKNIEEKLTLPNSCGFTAPISSMSPISMKYWKQMSSSGINPFLSAPVCEANSCNGCKPCDHEATRLNPSTPLRLPPLNGPERGLLYSFG